MENFLTELVNTWGVPGAITGLCFWLLKRDITERDAKRDAADAERERKAEERDRNRMKLEASLVQTTNAALALGEATARAVQRIPDAHCNGDMHKALEYAAQVKHDQKEFLTSLGLHALHDD